MALSKYYLAVMDLLVLLTITSSCTSPLPASPKNSSQPIIITPSVVNESPTPLPSSTPTPNINLDSTEEPTQTETLTPEPKPTESATPLPESPTPVSIWQADGVIETDEYRYFEDFSGLRFWWKNDAEYMYFAIEGDTTGWVAVGLNPEHRMKRANFLLGYYSEEQAMVWDAYGTAPTGPNHPPDVDLGGTDDIVDFAGYEVNGTTTFEIQIPLNSGDSFDNILKPGQTYPYIIAMGDEDNFNAFHIKIAGGQLILDIE